MKIAAAGAGDPKTVGDLKPPVFHRALDGHQMSFAFGELVAHLNYLVRQGILQSGVRQHRSATIFPKPTSLEKCAGNIKPLFNFEPPAAR